MRLFSNKKKIKALQEENSRLRQKTHFYNGQLDNTNWNNRQLQIEKQQLETQTRNLQSENQNLQIENKSLSQPSPPIKVGNTKFQWLPKEDKYTYNNEGDEDLDVGMKCPENKQATVDKDRAFCKAK